MHITNNNLVKLYLLTMFLYLRYILMVEKYLKLQINVLLYTIVNYLHFTSAFI